MADFDLEVADGQFVVLLGPSGCGKTTTLNCIAGLEQPTSGRILFGDLDVTELPPHARNIAMVFQSALLYPHLTARANIELSLRHSGMTADQVRQRVQDVVVMLRVDQMLDKKPSALSGGERQRVALAKALVREPTVFLMDEPFSALDAALRTSLRAELVHLQKTLNVTTIFVTHDQVEAMTMGDMIVVMDEGRVEQVGTPDEIYNVPQTRFVAGFIGSPPMNFFEGSIQAEGGELRFRTGETTFAIPQTRRDSVEKANNVTAVGLRPQHLHIAETVGEGAINVIVYAVERLGKETVIILNDDAGVTFRVLTDPGFKAAVGDRLVIAPDMEHAHFF
ncbi:MAG: ABC transporter ATP-binding protein [Hyphomicrobiales bacterium]|nr:ABC transporter ATP-binding protein [Hyphomicrobiales bacterium]